MYRKRFDIAIVGSGFAGSLLAMIATRLGLSAVLLERGSHPRIVIGESTTPLTNLLLEELVDRYDLPQLRPFCKWGSWQTAYPHIGCGLKRGFTFYHHDLRRPSSAANDRTRQLLVAASPSDEIADTHWYRADFDAHLVDAAQDCGVEYFDRALLEFPRFDDNGVSIAFERNGESHDIDAEFLIDASGPRGYLHRALCLDELELPGFPRTQALYSHFRGVTKLADDESALPGTPFPIDDAAVHHVFDGGWVWVLRFNNGITSAGVAAIGRVADRLDFSKGSAAWAQLVERIPDLQRQFAGATPLYEFRHIPKLPFHSVQIAGSGWAMLPSAAGFVDPLLSTGFPLTLLGIGRLAAMMAAGELRNREALAEYAKETDADLLATARLTAALYASMGDFPSFTARTMLYFAAASYSEAARRLRKPHLAPGFLLRDHPVFARTIEQLAARPADRDLASLIRTGVEPFNVAGLCNTELGDWYPARAEDLLASAHKLDATQGEVADMLRRCGMEAPVPTNG